MNCQTYKIPVSVMFPSSMWNWLNLQARKSNKSNSDIICSYICKFLNRKYSIRRSLKVYTEDFGDVKNKGHQVSLPLEILNVLNEITIDVKKNRSLIICSICYRFMKSKGVS